MPTILQLKMCHGMALDRASEFPSDLVLHGTKRGMNYLSLSHIDGLSSPQRGKLSRLRLKNVGYR
jgi:hypothetical protein